MEMMRADNMIVVMPIAMMFTPLVDLYEAYQNIWLYAICIYYEKLI